MGVFGPSLLIESTDSMMDLSTIKAWVTVEWTVFIDNLNVVYFSISTSYEHLLCTNRKFHLYPFL